MDLRFVGSFYLTSDVKLRTLYSM